MLAVSYLVSWCFALAERYGQTYCSKKNDGCILLQPVSDQFKAWPG